MDAAIAGGALQRFGALTADEAEARETFLAT